MKLSNIAIPTALAILANAEKAPVFKPFDKSQLSKSSFFEQFDSDDWSQLWKISKAKKDDEFSYTGEWAVEEHKIFPGLKGDKGLVLKTKAAHHAIHVPLETPFDNTDNTLVAQYEVKLQEGLSCGGAYVKLLSAEGGPSDDVEFNNESPYQVMFGPDKCGTTNKVHLILRRKNPNTGVYEEKHLAVPPLARTVKTSTLYTLIIEPTQEFEIRINGEVVKAGNLLDEGVFEPSFDPPKEIPDESDEKPADWDDRAKIPDPEQTEKPEDWDETAPYMIPDPEAVKPESWDESAEEFIPDPEAEKPEDWDEEEDGEWIAPTIPNPECEAHGCGKWIAPKIKNPAYKGKWTQPLIDNPDYKGEWAPKNIANPDWYHDATPSDLEPIGAIGFELWSMDADILFDDIYLGHSVEEAELIGNDTWAKKFELEQDAVLAYSDDSKAKEESGVEEEVVKATGGDDAFAQLQSFIDDAQEYLDLFMSDPVNTLSSRPAEAALYGGLSFIVASIVLFVVSSILNVFTPAPTQAKKEKKPVAEAEAEVEVEQVETKEETTSTSVQE